MPCSRCGSRSRSSSPRPSRNYSQKHHTAPTHTPPIYVSPAAVPKQQQGSVFKDAAAVAGGVTVGTAMGHVAGEAITNMVGGRRHEHYDELPRDYDPNTQPSGPCAFEIGQFLNCASVTENIQDCQAFSDALRECKRKNRIP